MGKKILKEFLNMIPVTVNVLGLAVPGGTARPNFCSLTGKLISERLVIIQYKY